MFMRHHWQLKGFDARLAAGTAEQAFGPAGIGVAARGDGWVLGQSGGALVLAQAMPVNARESHVIVVVAAENEAALGLCDKVAEHVRKSVRFDDNQ